MIHPSLLDDDAQPRKPRQLFLGWQVPQPSHAARNVAILTASHACTPRTRVALATPQSMMFRVLLLALMVSNTLTAQAQHEHTVG